MAEVKEYKLPSRNGRLFGTYIIPQPLLREVVKKFPGANIDAQIEKMVAWLEKEPDRQKKDEWYPEFILNWFARAAGQKVETDRNPRSAGSGGGSVGSEKLDQILKEIKLINERIGALQRLVIKRMFEGDEANDASGILKGAKVVDDAGDDMDDGDYDDEPAKKAPPRDDEDLPF